MLDGSDDLQAARTDVASTISFCRGFRRAGLAAFSLKQQRCPHCGCVETLNRHSKLHGNDASTVDARAARGQRVFCSNRGQRGGCGRTFSLMLAQVLPRHTFTASWLWKTLIELLAGRSLKATAEKLRLPFALETVYRLRRKLRQQLDPVRTLLCRQEPPPSSLQSDPVLQTVEHLQKVFAAAACPPAAFQAHFQRPLLG